MSIELTGPKKYKFQDYVCALLAILAVTDADTSLHIEPQDGEDALLTLSKEGNTRLVEIQVKGTESQIETKDLADWLAHFPARKSVDSLLERIVSDAKRSVLFVASGRCNDATAIHTVALSAHVTSLSAGTLTSKTEMGMRAALDAYTKATPSTDKNLAKCRRAHIKAVLPRIPTSALKDALHRVLIVEQLDDLEVLRRSRETLRSLHEVVPDQVEDVLGQIEAIVFREKRSGKNMLPEVAKIIARGKAMDPLVAASYVPRSEEAALLDRLSRQNAVLVTGAPRVGKSFCARNIGATLQKQGYNVRVCGDLAEADRFLTEPVAGYRVALVDDPLGGAHPADNAHRDLQLLERLIPRLTNGRKLIVAQAQDRLLEVTRLRSVEKINTAGLSWVSMGNGEAGFLAEVWADAATAYSVPTNFNAQIADAIASAELNLEPGCLVHLAANHSRLLEDKQLNDVVRFARQDAKSLGSALRQEQLAPLLNALAVATTQDLHVGEVDLAFVLDSSRIDRPGESDVVGSMITFGSEHEVKASAPRSYIPPPALSQQAIDSLERLELRRILVDRGLRYTFSHSFYRASAESLLDSATRNTTATVISLVERALFTISPDTARATATNLGWIYRNLDTEEGRAGVINVASRGLNSIFPAVRDICFQFLVGRLHSLPVEQQKEISDWVKKVTFPKLSYVQWAGDQPLMPETTSARCFDAYQFFPHVTQGEVNEHLALLNSDRPNLISNEATARAVMYLEGHPDAMTKQMAERLLSYDVSLIRASAAKAWLKRPRSGDALVLERIFSEQHPAVVRAVYSGVLNAWQSCDDDRRRALTRLMQKMAASPVSAVVLIDLLVAITRIEHGDKVPPWQLFEAVMPIVLRELPPGASIRDERLYDVMSSAVGMISQSGLLEIVDLWGDLVEEFSRNVVPSDYMLGVTDIVVAGVAGCSGERQKRIERLLALPGTACRIRVVSDLVDSWDQLSHREQSLLLKYLKAVSLDEIWVQAAALTRATVPAEIQKLVIPSGIDLWAPPNEVIAKVHSQLLNTCLRVFTGNHPVIRYIGVHGARNSAWKAIALEIVLMPTHDMFEPCWEWLTFTENPTLLAQVASELGADHSERIASLLLARKQRTSGEFMPEVWNALFELRVSDDVKSDWIARMAAIAPNALDSLAECKCWIPESHREEFISHFAEDVLIHDLLHKLPKILNVNSCPISKDLSSALIEFLRLFIEKLPPRHWSTYDAVLGFLRSLGVDDRPFTLAIEEKRSKGIEEAYKQPQQVVPKLEQWVGRF